jgi:predicted permease
MSGLSLDTRLGFRMLRRYPGLTFVGGLAMAFAIFVGAALFEFIRQTLPGQDLPIPHGDRVVGVRLWDRSASVPVPLTGAQIEHWRRSLTSVELLGGFSGATKPVSSENGQSRVEEVAVMSPAGFTLAGTAPLMGRVFTDQDLDRGDIAVAVISSTTWKTMFDGSADALGQRLRVGEEWVTVIGVMPDGFKFPINHSLWLPLDARRAGGTFRAFGRLREGVTLEQAEREMLALAPGLPASATNPHLKPLVQWYRASLFDRPLTLLLRVLVQQLNAFAGLFLMLVTANIALLMFARAATRERELVVRSALGAGRRRIVMQFLVEAMTLFGIAAVIGLAATGPGLAWIERRIGDMGGGISPFWFSPTVSLETAVYAGILTVAASLMAGGIPALRATRQLGTSRLQEAGGGAGRLQLGGIWTAVVIAQVAATVIFTAGALLMWRQARLSGSIDANFVAADYVDLYVGAERFERLRALQVGLQRFPGVAGVTMADRLPLMPSGGTVVEVEGSSARVTVSMPVVDVGFFDVFRAPLLSGRGFIEADRGHATGVVVDQAFANAVLGGRSAVGHRVRVAADATDAVPGPWLEIIGVVRSLEPEPTRGLYLDDQKRPSVYSVVDPANLPAHMHVAMHIPGVDSGTLLAIRQRVSAADASITVHQVQTLDRAVSAESAFWRFWAELVLIASVVTFLLALAGIYAVMSFTVTRRTREIGIRMALGAGNARVALEVLRGPLQQVGVGIVLGCVIVTALYWTVTGQVAHVEFGALALFAVCIALVCALACLEPARRALNVQPSRSLGDNA